MSVTATLDHLRNKYNQTPLRGKEGFTEGEPPTSEERERLERDCYQAFKTELPQRLDTIREIFRKLLGVDKGLEYLDAKGLATGSWLRPIDLTAHGQLAVART